MKPKNPQTDGEWQDAVDAAEGALHLDSARKYGLVTGGPAVNVERCEEILRRGAHRGVAPRPGAVERFVKDLFLSPEGQNNALRD